MLINYCYWVRACGSQLIQSKIQMSGILEHRPQCSIFRLQKEISYFEECIEVISLPGANSGYHKEIPSQKFHGKLPSSPTGQIQEPSCCWKCANGGCLRCWQHFFNTFTSLTQVSFTITAATDQSSLVSPRLSKKAKMRLWEALWTGSSVEMCGQFAIGTESHTLLAKPFKRLPSKRPRK